ncbi:MAG: hypothetical protein ACI9QQ_000625 [Myxococcota bacterium]|jgi:hypothetical protein
MSGDNGVARLRRSGKSLRAMTYEPDLWKVDRDRTLHNRFFNG